MSDLDQYAHLWTTASSQWELKDLGDGDFLIFNSADNSALSIDDDDLYQIVVQKMINGGAKISKM